MVGKQESLGTCFSVSIINVEVDRSDIIKLCASRGFKRVRFCSIIH